MTAERHDAQPLREQIAKNQQTIDRLNRDLSRVSNEVRIIQQISREITSTLDLDEVLGIVLRAMERVLGFKHAMILLKDMAADRVRVAASRGYEPSGVGADVAFGEGVIGVVASRRKMMRTIGAIGFEGRWDYGAIGTVTNLAARLCGEAQPGQILLSARVASGVEDLVETEEVGVLALKGFARPVPAFNLLQLKPPA